MRQKNEYGIACPPIDSIAARQQGVDQHSHAGQLIQQAADVLGPILGAAGARVRIPVRVREDPTQQAGGDLLREHAAA